MAHIMKEQGRAWLQLVTRKSRAADGLGQDKWSAPVGGPGGQQTMNRFFAGIIDSTLREGEQAPGVTFSRRDRTTLVRDLVRLGVDEIELGIAAPANDHIPALVNRARQDGGNRCRLGLWCRCRPEDIRFAARCRPDVLSLSMPVSDLHIHQRLRRNRAWVAETVAASVRRALDLGIPRVAVGLEDGSRADTEFLLRVAAIARAAGAFRVRLADTVGICSPASLAGLVRRLRENVDIEIGVHCHNDFGMATANSIAALEAGAGSLDATVLGIGERAGNCRLEEVIGFLALQRGCRRYRPELLPGLCRRVARAGGLTIAENHPLVGARLFTCETGLHQHGLAVNPATYEPYDPGRVGAERKLLFGLKTGTRAVHLHLARQGIELTGPQLRRLVSSVRALGRTVDEKQLLLLAGRQAKTPRKSPQPS